MIRRIHPAAGLLALATILVFWTGTVTAELFGGPEAIAAVKRAILWGLLLLVPAMIAAGTTGTLLAGSRVAPFVLAKKKRMPFIALNGVLVLVPSAFTLDHLAAAGSFGTTFVAVQAIELIAGIANITLLTLNARDGFRLGRRSSAK
jgi:hypothetical protein